MQKGKQAAVFALAAILRTMHGNAQSAITLAVDASNIANGVLSVHEAIPVTWAPEITFVYPKWIPGDHGPTGPITDLVNLHFCANGKPLPWHRDPIDMYAFHVALPADVKEVTADFSSVNLGDTSTPVQGDLLFNRVVLYPANSKSDDVQVRPSITVPSGWSYATALPDPQRGGNDVRFGEVSLTTLIDSPVMMGKLMKEFNIAPKGETRPVYLDLFAETPEGLVVPPERVEAFRNLVAETGAFFGSVHYTTYRFLVEEYGNSGNGTEHHQSSDNHVPELGMSSPSFFPEGGWLLAHEFSHSWNGKFRRPAGLLTPNYQEPMNGELLWVYEGLSDYLGEVLAVRSGLEKLQSFQERLAGVAATMDYRNGRDWRPLQDTATAAQLLYDASPNWEAVRRGTDFYREGTLLWLDVDSTIRTQSHGSRSIEDFAHEFYGTPNDRTSNRNAAVVPYTFEEVVTALNGTVKYDWVTFLRARLDALRPTPPSGGLEAAGWHVVYTSEPSDATTGEQILRQRIDLRYSVGLIIGENGEIVDVLPDSVAGRAGLAPGWKMTSVGKRMYTPEVFANAITAAKGTASPISLTLLRNGYYAEFQLDYHNGLRYPHLEPIPRKADILTAIAQPRLVSEKE